MRDIEVVLLLLVLVTALTIVARRLTVPRPIVDGGAAEQELLEHGQVRRDVIDAERRAAFDLHERCVITDDVLRRLERDLDLEELRMEA